MPEATITILCENSASTMRGILGEHGFSALVTYGAETVLFDTGQGYSLLHNAEALDIDLRGISALCLSHGHFDHTGGLAQVLQRIGPRTVYAHPEIFAERFSQTRKCSTTDMKSAGMPLGRRDYENLGARFIFNTDFCEIGAGVFLTGEVPRTHAFEHQDRRLVLRRADKIVPDPVIDDQSLVLQTAKGLVVVLGCAHAGIINILTHITATLPGWGIHMVLGGTHLGFLDQQQFSRTIDELQRFSIERIGAAHCTGMTGAARLKHAFGERFFFASAGTVITV